MEKNLEKIAVAVVAMLLRAIVVMGAYSAIGSVFALPCLSYWQIFLAAWAVRCLFVKEG